jgi:HSP20 family protein
VLTISGTRVPVETGEAKFVGRPFGSFTQTLTLPKGIDGDAIRAEYGDGVLTLHVPKPAQAKPKKIEISSGPAQKVIEQ